MRASVFRTASALLGIACLVVAAAMAMRPLGNDFSDVAGLVGMAFTGSLFLRFGFTGRIAESYHKTLFEPAPAKSIDEGCMKYGCKGKRDILLQLNYMILHAPDEFPPEGGMTLSLAFESVEYGLRRLESYDGRPGVLEAVARVRIVLKNAHAKFEQGDVIPACRLLQDAEELLCPVRVKAAVV